MEIHFLIGKKLQGEEKGELSKKGFQTLFFHLSRTVYT